MIKIETIGTNSMYALSRDDGPVFPFYSEARDLPRILRAAADAWDDTTRRLAQEVDKELESN